MPTMRGCATAIFQGLDTLDTMQNYELSRHQFFGQSIKIALALPALLAVGQIVLAGTDGGQVFISPSSPLPMRTAASALAAHTGSVVVEQQLPSAIGAHDIVLALGNEAVRYPIFSAAMKGVALESEWELVCQVESGGLLIAGPTPRNVCHAALSWIDNPKRELNRLSRYEFKERFTMWDCPLNQWYRFTEGFDRQEHFRQIALMGHTGAEINRYSDEGGFHVNHRKFPGDSYAWYLSYGPALDAFVESSLTKGLYPQDELAANLKDISDAAELARSYGLKPGFVCYEPRCVSEAVFDRHPGLRGSRTDHPGRSLEPRYALDIANPLVLEHYAESLTELMKTVPDLRYLVFWTQDSGSGMPFSRRLYAGPNGSYLARSMTLEKMSADFASTLLEAGRKINPEFEVIMKMGWEYADEERLRITKALPEGVTVSHILGSHVLQGQDTANPIKYLREDRELGKEPYIATTVSTQWDDAPLLGIPAPTVLYDRFKVLRAQKVQYSFTLGGVLSSPQCPYSINQELYRELIRNPQVDFDVFLLETATEWCDGKERPAKQLVKAWKDADQTLTNWPFLKWYDAGVGQTQGRWLTRPLVPDVSMLTAAENLAWERAIFTLDWDVGRKNIAFEGGIRMYTDEQLDRGAKAYREKIIPGLTAVVEGLAQELEREACPVLQDQHDRYKGLLLLAGTVGNLFDVQAAINYYLLKEGDPQQHVQRIDKAIEREIANTEAWLQLFADSKTNFMRISARAETPFIYKTPVEDLRIKLAAMKAHRGEAPGPFVKELTEPHTENHLLFY